MTATISEDYVRSDDQEGSKKFWDVFLAEKSNEAMRTHDVLQEHV